MRVQWHQAAGPAQVMVRAAVPDGDWGRSGRESTVVQLWLDGAYHQDLILVHGAEPFSYVRFLGALPAGEHTVDVRPHPTAPARPAAAVLALDAGPLYPQDPLEALAWRHTPWIYTRAEADPWESLWTDTPLLLFYRADEAVLEFQCLFSNEDGGTDTRGLLAQWGRTTDIEWVLRLERRGGACTIQGRDHVTETHRGTRADDRLTLQVVGVHGMVSSEVPWGAMRFLFLPRYRWDDALPRETVMDAHPWTYRLTALEMAREGKLFPASAADDPTPGDLADYAFVQLLRTELGTRHPAIEVIAHLADGRAYSSTHGDLRHACRRPYPFSTTVKLPRGAQPVAIEAVAHGNAGADAGGTRLRLHRAFRLGADHLPLPPFAGPGSEVLLTAGTPRARLWSAG